MWYDFTCGFNFLANLLILITNYNFHDSQSKIMSDNYNQMNQKLQFIDVSYKYTARELKLSVTLQGPIMVFNILAYTFTA